MLPQLTALLAAASLANAHFVLTFPATIGFDDDKESTGPCGGFTPDFASDNVTDFHVGGDNIATNLLHPQGTWLYRATLDASASLTSANWTQLYPEFVQTNIGKLCQPSVTAPAAWAGKQGVLSVVVDAPDGLLYQCAAVNFVAGAAAANQADCTNSSKVTAAFGTDSNLASLIGETSTSSSSNASSTTTTSSPSSASSAAAATTSAKSAAGRISGPAAGVAMAVLLGSALMI